MAPLGTGDGLSAIHSDESFWRRPEHEIPGDADPRGPELPHSGVKEVTVANGPAPKQRAFFRAYDSLVPPGVNNP